MNTATTKPTTPTPARLLLLPLLAVAVLAVALLSAPGANAVVPRAPHSSGPIEGLAPYVAQTSCDPHIKPGTAELGALLHRTWPNIAWSSVRACDSSVSEHHDGRAIDWMASVRNGHSYAQGRSMTAWLLAPDSHGNRWAMARRLGVMYVIYNNKIWGAWNQKWTDYNGCTTSTRLRARSYDDYCHRSHVHISLSWNGAEGRTSFWTGHVYRTDYGPCPIPHHHYAPAYRTPNYTPCR